MLVPLNHFSPSPVYIYRSIDFILESFTHTFSIFLFFKFEQFSRIIGDAAVEQQRDMSDAIRAFANFYSKSAQDAGAIWPFFLLPNYEIHASTVRKQTGLETLDVVLFVKDEDSVKVIEMVTNTHEKWINESHMYGYGHLNRLSPTKYTPHFTIMTPDGPIPDIVEREVHFPMVLLSPRTCVHIDQAHWYFHCQLLSNISIFVFTCATIPCILLG